MVKILNCYLYAKKIMAPSFYYLSEFQSKILNSYAIYRCKKMVKILKCYLYAKKSYGTLSKGAIFLAIPAYQKQD